MYVIGVLLGAALMGLTGCGSAVSIAEASADDPAIESYRFVVEVEGETVGAFRGVSGLDSETEVIEYQDGTDKTLRKRPGRLKYSNIVLKKGYLTETKLRVWWEEIQRGEFVPKNGTIPIFDRAGDAVDQYNFYEGWPCKWKGFSLDESNPGPVIEEIELCVEGLERVRPPAPPPPGGDER